MAKWILGTHFGRAETKWSTTFGKRAEQPVAFAGEVMGGVLREGASKVWQKHHLPYSTVLPDSFWASTLPHTWLSLESMVGPGNG